MTVTRCSEAGQGAGQGRAGQGRAGQGRAGQGAEVTDLAVQLLPGLCESRHLVFST